MEMLQALHDSPLAVGLRGADIGYPLLSAGHILSLALLIGAIATLDLRLLGLFRAYSLAQLGPPLSLMAAAGAALALVTGFFLFSVRPVAYVQNPAFVLKLSLVALGIVNALSLRLLPYWREALAGGEIHRALRLSALISLAAWIGAAVSGRWIAFL